jgi:hypothetical protein
MGTRSKGVKGDRGLYPRCFIAFGMFAQGGEALRPGDQNDFGRNGWRGLWRTGGQVRLLRGCLAPVYPYALPVLARIWYAAVAHGDAPDMGTVLGSGEWSPTPPPSRSHDRYPTAERTKPMIRLTARTGAATLMFRTLRIMPAMPSAMRVPSVPYMLRIHGRVVTI